MEAFQRFVIALTVIVFSTNAASPRSCTRNDYAKMEKPCDANTQTRSIVFYLNSSCEVTNTSIIPKPIFNLPCVCEPGKGLTPNNKCQSCPAGTYSAGADILDVWNNWSENGTVPPQETGITVYCDNYRQQVKPCESWKASDDNEYLESGDNTNTRCMQSVMTIKRQFISTDSYVSFDYHVQGRKCYNNYYGCDGLWFYIDKKRVLAVDNLFKWTNFKINVTKGYHQLKWVYRKNCYSYSRPGYLDKAFIKTIVMAGVIQPNSDCRQCPKGTYSSTTGAKVCRKCSYFTYQDQSGQKSCKPCPVGYYAMIGDSVCVPLRNCTNDDLIVAPGDISECKKNAATGKIVTTVTPKYHDMPELKGKLLCNGKQLSQTPEERPCRCQPGFEVKPSKSGSGYMCFKCDQGLYSDAGITCKKCPGGQVALTGKHFYYWPKGSLPQGFTSDCVGNCNNKGGWIPSGDVVRTGHVIGDVDSYIETPEYEVVSSVAEITFNCSIQCNVTKPKGSLRGAHLADPKDCLLTLQVFKDGNFSEGVNCTRPKGKYIYRHQNNRDGRTVFHRIRLTQKGKYKFRWQFHQSDESRSLSANFEAKLSAISVVGVKDGEARNCTRCPSGYFNSKDGTDCGICDKGHYSEAGSDSCTRCPDGTFAPKQGTPKCLRCGLNTKSNKNNDGCLTNGCRFSPKPEVDYDLSMLSRPGGPMFNVLRSKVKATKQTASSRSRRRTQRSYPPYSTRYFLNLCTVEHDNSSCTRFDVTGSPFKRVSYPTMACKTGWSWEPTDYSLGTVIGYRPKKDPLTGLTVELLHGDRCYRGRAVGWSTYNSTVDMICDMKAGVGNPEYNATNFWRTECTYPFIWRSIYACPKCRPEYFKKVYSACVDGRQNATYTTAVPCWGDVEAIPKDPIEGECVRNNTVIEYTRGLASPVNKVLIGVGVVVVLALIVVAVFFFCKHRNLRFKYFSMATRNKPMSRLEEEDDEAMGRMEDDFYHSGANAPIVRP